MKFTNRDIIMVVVAILLITSTCVLGYFVLREEKEKESDLRVDNVYFVMEGADSERSQIKIVVFISNVGNKDVSKLQIRAFTVETGSNLAMDDSSATINDVKQKTTVEGNLVVDVPNNESYRMELLIFKDEQLEIRGSGTIDLTDVGASYDYRNYPDYDDDDDATGGGVADSTAIGGLGGACVVIIVVGVIIGIIVYAVVKSGDDKKKRKEDFFKEGTPPHQRLRRPEPKLEDFGEKNAEEQLLEREAKWQRNLEERRSDKFAPPLKEEKIEHPANNDK